MAVRAQVISKRSTRKRSAWDALATHYNKVSKLHLRKLFADDSQRGARMAIQAAGLYLDYSKNRVTDETLKLLFELATDAGLKASIRPEQQPHTPLSGEVLEEGVMQVGMIGLGRMGANMERRLLKRPRMCGLQ